MLISLAFPVEAIVANAVSVARPLLGLGVLAVLMFVFKPLLMGLLRAALLLVKPRQSLEQQSARAEMRSILKLNCVARELESTQPSLAKELRAIVSRS